MGHWPGLLGWLDGLVRAEGAHELRRAGAVSFLLDRARDVLPGGPALDVGTGTGSVAAAVSAAGFDVRGVDADPDMVAFAKSRVPAVEFSLGALPELSFDGDEFVLTTASFVVNHVLKPRTAVQELARVAAPEGTVLITVWPSRPVAR